MDNISPLKEIIRVIDEKDENYNIEYNDSDGYDVNKKNNEKSEDKSLHYKYETEAIDSDRCVKYDLHWKHTPTDLKPIMKNSFLNRSSHNTSTERVSHVQYKTIIKEEYTINEPLLVQNELNESYLDIQYVYPIHLLISNIPFTPSEQNGVYQIYYESMFKDFRLYLILVSALTIFILIMLILGMYLIFCSHQTVKLMGGFLVSIALVTIPITTCIVFHYWNSFVLYKNSVYKFTSCGGVKMEIVYKTGTGISSMVINNIESCRVQSINYERFADIDIMNEFISKRNKKKFYGFQDQIHKFNHYYINLYNNRILTSGNYVVIGTTCGLYFTIMEYNEGLHDIFNNIKYFLEKWRPHQ